jgi:hypothetical protein
MVLAAQDYCMIYRFSCLCASKRAHKMFMSKLVRFGFIVLQQTIAISISILSYRAIVRPEVITLLIT